MGVLAKLSAKQERFCQEYLIDLNGAQAATRSGYSQRTARFIAARLLTKANIGARIAELKTERSARTQVSQDRVLQEWAKIGFSNLGDYFQVQADGSAFIDLSAMTRDQAAALQEITIEESVERAEKKHSRRKRQKPKIRNIRKIKIKLGDKKGALDSVARHLGMFVDRSMDVPWDGDPKKLTDAQLEKFIEHVDQLRGEPAEKTENPR